MKFPKMDCSTRISFLSLFAVLLSQFPVEVSPARILSVEFFGSKSHVITYLALLEELSHRGHTVTVVGPADGLAKEKGLKEISTYSLFDILRMDSNTTMFLLKEEGKKPSNPFTMMTKILPQFCSELYRRDDIKELMQEEFDLILFQSLFNDCAAGFVSRIMTNSNSKGKTPLVIWSTTSVPNFMVKMIGGHYPPSFVPNPFLGFRDEMDFFERLVNTGMNFVIHSALTFYYIPAMEQIYRNSLGQDTPSVKELMGSASLLLSNSHFSLHGPKPNLPDVVDVGGIHSRDARELPKELEDFIQRGGEHGFILFSLGSALRSDQMSEEKRNIFLNVFGKLRQQVVWKYESDSSGSNFNVPKNVYLSKWLPQQDLLGHEKIRMFITHCGGGGTEEAIYHGVPLIGMPFFGDQSMNAKTAENQGYLYRMEWNELSEEGLEKAIHEILRNPKYRDNVKKLSGVFRDQIDKPLNRGVWWMEYVLRHNGAPQLQSAGRNLNYFQYHSLDVLAAYLGIISFLVCLLSKIFKYICNKFCVKRKSNKFQANVGGQNRKKRN